MSGRKLIKQKLSSHISPTYSIIDMKVMVYIFTVLLFWCNCIHKA